MSQPLSDERSRILESCGDPWWYQEYIAPLFAEIDRLKEGTYTGVGESIVDAIEAAMEQE